MNDPRKTPPQPRPSTPPPRGAPPPQSQQQQPPPRIDEVRALVRRRMKPTLTTLLAKTVDVDRWAQVFLTALTANADLVRCSDASIARALMHSAEVGLMPGGAYPHCYLIPYWNSAVNAHEVQFQISVWGYTELVRRAGVKKVWADVVRENDPFECISGTAGKQIVHKPNWFASDEERGPVIGAYACALLENDEVVCEPASIEDINQARQQNKGKSPAWDLWFDQQAQKVAIKRLSKYLPKGEMPERALELDENPGARPVIEVAGFEVPGAEGAPSSPQGALDEAVAKARAAANSNAGAAAATGKVEEATINRDRLFQMLCELDERWKRQRARVDGWDEMQALAAMAYLHAVMRSDGNGILPDEPAHLKMSDVEDVIS